jgi:hypothetical protein
MMACPAKDNGASQMGTAWLVAPVHRKIPAGIYYVKYCLAVGQGNTPTELLSFFLF